MSLPDRNAISAAESRPIEFNPNERATYVRKCLQDIHYSIAENNTEDYIRAQFSKFVELYPELFKKIINKEDLSPVQNMLAMLDSMGDGKISQHQASIIVGKNLVDKYVTPQLNPRT